MMDALNFDPEPLAPGGSRPTCASRCQCQRCRSKRGAHGSVDQLELDVEPEAFDWMAFLRKGWATPQQGAWGYPFDLAELDAYYTPAERSRVRAAGVSASNGDADTNYRSLLGLVYRLHFNGHFPLYRTRTDWHGAVDIPIPAAAVGKFMVRSIGDGEVIGASIDASYSGMNNGGVIVVVRHTLADGRSFLVRYVHLHNTKCTEISSENESRVPSWDVFKTWSAAKKEEWTRWLRGLPRTAPLRPGTRVTRGQALGPLGYLLSGHHLHFEIISRDVFPGFEPSASRPSIAALGSAKANRYLSVRGDSGGAYWGPRHDSKNWIWYHPLHFVHRLNGGNITVDPSSSASASQAAPRGAPSTSATGATGAASATPPSVHTCPAPIKKKPNGHAAYGGGDVGAALRQLRAASKLSVSDDDIDVLRRIAAVESGGHLTAINSWDSAVMSAGFMQWTLKYGELAEWIRAAAADFRRHGIELEASRTYSIGDYRPAAIAGAARAEDLRSCVWAQRFYAATIDPSIVTAQVRMALDSELPAQRRRIASKVNAQVSSGWDRIQPHYERSSVVRALFHETYNNRPVCAYNAAVSIARTLSRGALDSATFLVQLRQAIVDAYAQRNEKDKGLRLTTKVIQLPRA